MIIFRDFDIRGGKVAGRQGFSGAHQSTYGVACEISSFEQDFVLPFRLCSTPSLGPEESAFVAALIEAAHGIVTSDTTCHEVDKANHVKEGEKKEELARFRESGARSKHLQRLLILESSRVFALRICSGKKKRHYNPFFHPRNCISDQKFTSQQPSLH